MNPVSAKPRPLVEAVLGRLRQPDGDDALDEGALRRRSSERELQLGCLAEAQTPEATNLRGHAELEPRAPRWPGDLEHAPLRRVHAREQHAAVKRRESRAAPPPPE